MPGRRRPPHKTRRGVRLPASDLHSRFGTAGGAATVYLASTILVVLTRLPMCRRAK